MINPISNNLLIQNDYQDSSIKESDQSFVEMLKDNIKKVNDLQLNADELSEDFALGKTDNIHQVTIATEEAQLALKLTVAIQNKVIDAYKEIMRLQV